jgi:hypothetical protein
MLCLPYYSCVFSSTKLVIRAERDLPRTERGKEGREGGGQGGEMIQTMHDHVNNEFFKKKTKRLVCMYGLIC